MGLLGELISTKFWPAFLMLWHSELTCQQQQHTGDQYKIPSEDLGLCSQPHASLNATFIKCKVNVIYVSVPIL